MEKTVAEMKSELLAIIDNKLESLERNKFGRNQAHAYICAGGIDALKDVRKEVEKYKGVK